MSRMHISAALTRSANVEDQQQQRALSLRIRQAAPIPGPPSSGSGSSNSQTITIALSVTFGVTAILTIMALLLWAIAKNRESTVAGSSMRRMRKSKCQRAQESPRMAILGAYMLDGV